MHPAFSVILFTTASGAGYGLLALARALRARRRLLPPTTWFGLAALGLAAALITRGPPEFDAPSRPARAGAGRVLAMALVLAVARGRRGGRDFRRRRSRSALGWVFLNDVGGFVRRLAAALPRFSPASTVVCTAMIYASLKPIRQWSNALDVLPVYLALRP